MITTTARRAALAGAFSLGLLVAGSASAQESRLDPRWYAWLGCWEPEAALTGAGPTAPTVCVIPAATGSGVEVATLENGAVVAREPMSATGEPVALQRESCSGSTTASWSADGRRVYRTSQLSCPGGFQRNSTGIMAMTPAGEWIDVEGLAAPLDEAVRVMRYRPLLITGQLPAEIESALAGHGTAARTARLAVSGQATLAEVAEASGRVGAAVTQAWLVERGQGFALELDAARLLALREAGVPDRVIDMVVALSYPQRFAVNRDLRQAGAVEREREPRSTSTTAYDAWGYPTYGWGYGARYGRYGYGYGYDPYGYGPYGHLYGTPRVIVVEREADAGESPRRGRMVNGTGYSRPDNPGPSSSSGGSSSGGSSGGGSSAGSSGGSSGGGGGAVRTAKPRD